MRRWIALSLLLVFGAGLGVGLTTGHLQKSSQEAPPTSPIDPFEDGWIYLVSSESVYDELELTAAQREELDVALTSHFRNVTEVRQALRDVASKLEVVVAGVLTEAQRQKLSEIRDRYNQAEFQQLAARDVAHLRQVAQLTPSQEAFAYQLFFDTARERRALWKAEPKPSREIMRSRMREIRDRRDDQLRTVLEPEVFARYSEMKSQARRFWKGHRGQRRGSPPKDGPPPDGVPPPPPEGQPPEPTPRPEN